MALLDLLTGKRTGPMDQRTPVLKRPFSWEANRPDEWNWPYYSATVHKSAGYLQNFWWGNQLPNQGPTVWNTGDRLNAGDHKLWAPAPQWQISQLPYGQWQNQLGMSQSTTATLLQRMSSAWASLYGGG